MSAGRYPDLGVGLRLKKVELCISNCNRHISLGSVCLGKQLYFKLVKDFGFREHDVDRC